MHIAKYSHEVALPLIAVFGGSLLALTFGLSEDLTLQPQIIGYGAAFASLIGISGYFIYRKITSSPYNYKSEALIALIGAIALLAIALSLKDPAQLGIANHLSLFGFGVGAMSAFMGSASLLRMALNLKQESTVCTWKKLALQKGSRIIEIGSNDKGVAILVRKYPQTQEQRFSAPDEELAYLISKKFKLNVVPPTCYVKGQNPYVLQQAVSLHRDTDGACQFGLCNAKSRQRCLLFNIITGRHDAHIFNSLLDGNKMMHEADNEDIGFTTSDSWLFTHMGNETIDQDLIEGLMRFTVKDLDAVFADFALRHGPVNELMQQNIRANFLKLQQALSTVTPCTVASLQLLFFGSN